MMTFKDKFIRANGINIHYLDNEAHGKPKLFLLHGLTANAHAFDGVVCSGLYKNFHVIAPDLRGRGLSDHPAFCYTMNEHAEDIIGLLDYFDEPRATLAGHSFGGLLSFYLAANYGKRVSKVISLDAAAEMNPRAPEMLAFTLMRLDKIFNSFDEYVAAVKKAPYSTFWDDLMLTYYQADVKELPGGKVTPRSNLSNILEAAKNVSNEPWTVYINNIEHPVLLLNAVEAYSLGEPLLPELKARATVNRLKNGQYHVVTGNHHTMLYGSGAQQIANSITNFVSAPAA